MLTSDLSINYRRGEKYYPYLIKTDNSGFLQDAENLIAIFDEFQGRTRGELERELEEYVGTGTDFKILRGLIKLLTDRSEFETASVAAPEEIRQKVFLEARKSHPVFPDSPNKVRVLQTVADEFKTNVEEIRANLFADLFAQQRLASFANIAPLDLLDRYNLAQAQAILYKCVEMKITVGVSDAANYRKIFGWIKHFGLIHSITGNAGDGYEITITGAASLFHRSQKYGIQMAVFLPALLLCGNWRMQAEINDKRGAGFYALTSEQTELVSNRYDEPEYANPDIEKLRKNWGKSASSWHLIANDKVVDLGKIAFIPDLILLSPEGEEIYLEVLGFWTPKAVQKRLAEFKAANFRKFIIAASHELRGSREEPIWTSENVIFYKTKIEPLLLIETAEKLLI